MTEPQVPVPDWDSLPVLTEVVDAPVSAEALPPQAEVPVLVEFDIPDFDFSAEMAQLADALPDAGLSFPPELTLDEVLSADEQAPDADADAGGTLDAEALIGRLPSLDRDVPLPDDMELDEVLPGFAMPEADVAPPELAPAVPAMESAATVPDATVSSLLREPAEDAMLAAAVDDVPRTAFMLTHEEEVTAVPSTDAVNTEVTGETEPALTVASAATGLAAWLDQAASQAPIESAPQLAPIETAPWEVPPAVPPLAAEEVVPTLPLEAMEANTDLAEVPLVAEPDEVLSSSVAEPVTPVADEAAAVMSGLVNIDDLIATAFELPQVAAVADAAATVADEAAVVMPDLASSDVVANAVELPPGEAVATMDVAAAIAPAMVEPPLLSDEAAVPLETAAALSVADEMAEPAEADDFAFDLAAAEGTAPAGVAAAYVQALDAASPVADGPAVPAYLLGQSISLDSLPTGVLGGGLGLAASLVAELEGAGRNDMLPDREVELAWARDLGAEPPFDLTPQDAVLPVHQVLAAPSAAAAPGEAGLAAAAMQLSGVKEVSQPPTVAPEAAAGEAPSSLDSEALIEALYARVLPRMKVELTLWMQDALEMQARQLMSGVMQHLKEDFDMMLAEALRESLREALREAKAGQGEQ